MSQAFVKDEDAQWLSDIAPTMNALINYLSRENNGIRVYEKSHSTDLKTGKVVYEMSNGISYFIGDDSKWDMIL